VVAAVGGASAIVLRRRLPHLRGAPAVLAFSTVFVTALIGVHLLPGALGLLSRWSVLGCALALLLVVAVRLGPATATSPEPAPDTDGDDDRVARLLAGAAVAAIGLWLVAQGWHGTVHPSVGQDSLTFHLPNVAAWIQSGTFWRVDQFTPIQANGNYPHNGDVVFLAAVLPWRNDAFTALVNVPFVGLAGLSVYAIARELRAPRSAAVAMGAAYAALPVVTLTVSGGAFTDAVMLAAFGAGVLFLVRHSRTARRSDLLLGGLGLGVAFGTKWAAVPAVLVVVGVWALRELLIRRPAKRVVRDAATVLGLVLLAGGFWLVRNLVESGNPVMPVKVAAFGQTFFDAAPDARSCIGFSIADYLHSPAAWRHYILPGYRQFLGVPGVLIVVTGAAATAFALRRRRREGPAAHSTLLLAAAATLIAAIYVVTPYTALGLRGAPIGAGGNLRYVLPGLLIAAALGARAAARSGVVRALVALVALGAVIDGIRRGYDLRLALVAEVALVLGALYAALRAARRMAGRRPAPLGRGARAAAAALALVVLAVVGQLRQADFNRDRYRHFEPTIDWIEEHAASGHRIGLAGVWDSKGIPPVLPAFGPRLGNRVAYVGEYRRGLLEEFEDRGRFLAAVRRGGYDLLIVGNDVYPPDCHIPGSSRLENAWALSAGYVRVAGNRRLTLYRVRGDVGAVPTRG
jgi:hypothetical protein